MNAKATEYDFLQVMLSVIYWICFTSPNFFFFLQKQTGGHEDYENVSGECAPKRMFLNIDWDSDSSESEEEEVNYTEVSFTVTPHHYPWRNVIRSEEEDKTEYSEVKA